jgi:hypothetical protein
MKRTLTQERLLTFLSYDKETGLFTWRKSKGRAAAGDIAGNLNNYGYIEVGLDNVSYTLHRLAWLAVYGVWPNGVVDHINGVRSDNRIANLRTVTTAENQRNTWRRRGECAPPDVSWQKPPRIRRQPVARKLSDYEKFVRAQPVPEKLTSERLRLLLKYDAETGHFTWLVPRGKRRPGGQAGNMNPASRYVQIEVDRRRYYAHRLAWFYVNGEWPDHAIDHINGDALDNRIANLRCATPSQNQHNKRRPANNTSGVKGIYWHKRRQRWCARATVGGKTVHFGYFKDIDEACRVYEAKVCELHGEFARLD